MSSKFSFSENSEDQVSSMEPTETINNLSKEISELMLKVNELSNEVNLLRKDKQTAAHKNHTFMYTKNDDFRYWLKKKSKSSNQIQFIIANANVYEKILKRFQDIQIPFKKHCGERKNFLPYSYCLHKFLELECIGDILFGKLAEQDNFDSKHIHQIMMCDILWEKICMELQSSLDHRDCNWTFIASVSISDVIDQMSGSVGDAIGNQGVQGSTEKSF